VGGDVLGSGGDQAASGLSGSVTLTGKGAEKANPYLILEEMIHKLIPPKTGEQGSTSPDSILSINRLSGSLYIKDKPSIVKTVGKLLAHYKSMLSRQILIESRIIEVTLSKGYEYGIDWSLVQASNPGTSPKLSRLSWNLSQGLVLNGFDDAYTFNSVISALETFGKVKIVSNPTIRAKHGNPAVISVGDSITYKKSVETTIEKTDIGQTEKTQVEVSTVFDGLILGVIPFIEATGKINLLINPVKSDVDTESINNPESVGGGVTISLPKVGIKEISTTITVDDGDIVIIGGLISSEDVKRDKDVPLISKLPLLGYLFQNDYVSKERKELVIILNVRAI
jgi:MSHA type pilus biogenesis protein MshL